MTVGEPDRLVGADRDAEVGPRRRGRGRARVPDLPHRTERRGQRVRAGPADPLARLVGAVPAIGAPVAGVPPPVDTTTRGDQP